MPRYQTPGGAGATVTDAARRPTETADAELNYPPGAYCRILNPDRCHPSRQGIEPRGAPRKVPTEEPYWVWTPAIWQEDEHDSTRR